MKTVQMQGPGKKEVFSFRANKDYNRKKENKSIILKNQTQTLHSQQK